MPPNPQRPVAARSNGGTSAPRSAAGGSYLSTNNRPAAYTPWDNGGKWNVAGAGMKQNRPNPAAPSAPSGAASPYAGPPWLAATEQEKAAAINRNVNTQNNLDLSQISTEHEYGLNEGNDYTNNPYSRAALLQQKYEQANRGTNNSAGLQLYSGSTGNRLANNRSGYAVNRDALEKQYGAALQKIREERLASTSRKGEEEDNATWKGIEAGEKQKLDPTQAPVSKRASRSEYTKKQVNKNRKGRK